MVAMSLFQSFQIKSTTDPYHSRSLDCFRFLWLCYFSLIFLYHILNHHWTEGCSVGFAGGWERSSSRCEWVGAFGARAYFATVRGCAPLKGSSHCAFCIFLLSVSLSVLVCHPAFSACCTASRTTGSFNRQTWCRTGDLRTRIGHFRWSPSWGVEAHSSSSLGSSFRDWVELRARGNAINCPSLDTSTPRRPRFISLFCH